MMGRVELGTSLPLVQETVQERWNNVGGITRFVLGTSNGYRARVETQNLAVAAQLNWKDTSLWSVGSTAKLFMSPEPTDDKVSAGEVSWKFLSPARAQAFFELVRGKDDSTVSSAVKTLDQFGLQWQVAEEFVCESLLKEQKSWEWYPDPGSAKLSTATMLSTVPPGFKSLSGVELFQGHFLWRNVLSLDPTKLYRSTGWQMVVGEYFSFSPVEKIVFLYQVSSEKPKDHSFKSTQCVSWRKALQMPPDWTLAIVYFLDQSHAQLPTGIEFDDKKHVSDLDAALHVKGFLVRAQLNPWSTPIAFGNDPVLTDTTKIWFASTTSKTFHTFINCSTLTGITPTESTYEKRGTRAPCKTCAHLSTL